jgi:hypothetical protein
MRGISSGAASALICGLALLCVSSTVRAQSAAGAASAAQPVSRVASLAAGSIHGVVQDEQGAGLGGVMVSALGASTAVAVSDRSGRFEFRTLSPGPYMVRAHRTGFIASRVQIVNVQPSSRASSAIAMRRATASGASEFPVLAAGVGAAAPEARPDPAPEAPVAETAASGGDHSEMAWRIRHARRGVLRDATAPEGFFAEGGGTSDDNPFGAWRLGGARVARATAGFLTGVPLSGQVNLLTTSSFDTPQQLFSTGSFARSIAYMSVGAAVGDRADWAVRAALTQGDIASWIVAGSYASRGAPTHQHNIGVAYSTQRYEGGNPAALTSVKDGSRNAGSVYGFDTWTITPAIALTYGGRYARYDYLNSRSLFSSRLVLALSPTEHFRIAAEASRRALAPGAGEFLPPADDSLWLPPQRTFSSLPVGRALEAECSTHLEVRVERDLLPGSTVSFRIFRQRVSDQLATMFGVRIPDSPPTELGHYFVANAGDVDGGGWGAGLRTAISERVHGSVEYTLSRGRWRPTDDLAYMAVLFPSSRRPDLDRVHDVATSIEARVPETATRVFVLYRLSSAFARPELQAEGPSIDARFDIQVRQSLPFMSFSTAHWEILLAVRNFFHAAAADQSIYDELLVVNPPKRIIGGLSLRF